MKNAHDTKSSTYFTEIVTITIPISLRILWAPGVQYPPPPPFYAQHKYVMPNIFNQMKLA